MNDLTEYLKALDYDSLINLAVKQEAIFAEIRGYASGITEKHLRKFDKETLIRCFKKNETVIKKHGRNTIEEYANEQKT